ncbi:MAG: S-layer homology domain-containing protein [Oscillospiraceae bacterium]|nr:S-layer homology domain-containing protein [Oscillospiraceae bacterium]
MKLNNKPVKSFFAGLLAIVMVLAIGGQPAFAVVSDDTMWELVEEYASPGSPEWEAFRKAWSDYFLDLMPNKDEPELLELLKVAPTDINDIEGWHEFFGENKTGTNDVMYQELKRVVTELDLDSPDLSLKEKADRIHGWTHKLGFSHTPFGWGLGGQTVDGVQYGCTNVAEGLVALFRVAGMPATNVRATDNHTEAYYYLDGEWRKAKSGVVWGESFEKGFGVRSSVSITSGYNAAYRGKDSVSGLFSIDDINESWIILEQEAIMGSILQRPIAHPERTLTRGEVAKLVCHYFGMVPMRNEKIFSDVELTHPNSRYIWGVNRAGIMSGDGDGAFRPDDTLSMQEFAVIASRMIEYGREKLAADLERQKTDSAEIIANMPQELLASAIESQGEIVKKKEMELARLNQPADRPAKVFADSDQIAAWAKPAVDELSRFKILQGDNNGRLDPTVALDKTRFLVFMAKFELALGLSFFSPMLSGSYGDSYPLF